MNLVLKQPRTNGMFPNFVDMSSGALQSSDYRLGAMGDSFYEWVCILGYVNLRHIHGRVSSF